MANNATAWTNLGAVHDATAANTPDRVALVDGNSGTSISYAEFSVRVVRAANALEGLGVRNADRVALFYPNDVRYLVTVLAVARIGAVPVPVNLELDREKLAYIIDDCEASVALVRSESTVPATVSSVIDEASGVETVAVDTNSPTLSLAETEVVPFRERLMTAADTHSPAAVSKSDPAMQPYTSGSTGHPKGVILSHGGVSWCTEAFIDHLNLNERERGLVVTPLYHKNAMTGVVKPMLQCRGSFVLLSEFDSEAVIEAVDTYDVTYMTGVPAIYKRLVAATTALGSHDLSSMTWASCGSAAVPDSLVKSFEKAFGADLLEVYGLTEGGPVVTHSPRDRTRKAESAGLALPDVETLVVDPETGESVPTGETGELLVASPGLGTYHNRPEANQARFESRDGMRVLHTGDLAKKDTEGYHYIVGRLDDMMIVGGENLYPADVENRLLRHEAVDDVAVVSVPHTEKGEAPIAFVVSSETITEDDLKTFAINHGPTFAHPRRIFFEEQLPLGGTGKVQMNTLRQWALEQIDGEL